MKIDIDDVRQLQEAAIDLRLRVSHGSCGEDELNRFWALVGNAGIVLLVSNPELSVRAGLGENFFASVVRDHRQPKLANFLRALGAIIEVADERLATERKISSGCVCRKLDSA